MPAPLTQIPRFARARTRLACLTYLAAPLTLLALWLPGCNDGDYRVDTGLYAALSKRIAENTTWDTLWYPMLGDAPYFNKPPLAFWLHAAFIKVLGMDLWTVRLPTLLAAMLAVFALQRAASLLAGRTAGLMAAMVLALTLEFFRYTRAFSLDLWLVAFMMLALWTTAAALRRWPDHPPLAQSALAGLFIGMGLLVKPLYALFLPAAAAVWLLWAGPKGARWRWAAWCAEMAIVGVAAALPWYVSMTLRWGDVFLREHFIRQSLERAIGGLGGDAPKGPGLMYLPMEMLGSYWPWMLTLALAILTLARTGRITSTRTLERLGITWSVLLGAALMAFAGKRSRYLLPIYPGLSMLSGAWLACQSPHALRRHARRALVLWCPTLPVIALAGALILPKIGIDFHQPASGEVERLQTAIREAGNPTVWTAPSARLEAAKLYAKGSPWPRAVGGLPHPQTEFPKTGDIVLYLAEAVDRQGTLTPRKADEPLGKFSGLFAVRVKSDWSTADMLPAP